MWLKILPTLLLLLAGAPAASAAKKAAKRKRKESRPPLDPVAYGHHQSGTMAHVQGDAKGAVRHFRAAIEAKPDFAYAYYRLGFVLHEMSQARPERASEDPIPAFRCERQRARTRLATLRILSADTHTHPPPPIPSSAAAGPPWPSNPRTR